MIDLGKLVTNVQNAVAIECEFLDDYITVSLGAVLPDDSNPESERFLSVWENTLDITSPPTDFNERINTIKSRLNANGKPTKKWFYEIAERLGWQRETSIKITDGETLAFRAGINATGDKVYDNISYTSLTINVRYQSKGAILDNALIQMFLFIRTLGTVIKFWEVQQ